MFDLNNFISTNVTKRNFSMFALDIKENSNILKEKIRNKSILVIGGAGSIGSSFIKALLNYEPSCLYVVDTNENALTELTRDLRSTKGQFIPKDYITYPMDFSSSVFEKMFKNHGGFDIVANFSAHKHVRSEKDIYSVEALLQNNVLHAKQLLDLLSEIPPKAYFCVSTDKAANPVNIMGASKRIMEDIIFSYSDKFPVKTARFANVAFSNGSLPAGFIARIQNMQPLSAPLDVKRYFVSPEESGQICLLACLLGANREIFFPRLDVAQMISFDKIAIDLLHEYGYRPYYCSNDKEAIDKSSELKYGGKLYPVHFSNSDTSGEKAFEEFYTNDEKLDMNRFEALGVVVDKKIPDLHAINMFLRELDELLKKEVTSKEEVVLLLKEYLPNFEHIEKEKSLDSKM
ncbi:polysaccharide biosynthesis protein [[Clostridium] innocuum]|nr:polysaccharide biosynthesis protein [[Clostridium] innocuum]